MVRDVVLDDSGEESDEPAESEEELDFDDLPENTYGSAIAVLVRDGNRLAKGTSHPNLRTARVVVSFFLLALNVLVQIFLLIEIKHFVTAKAVHDIREVYGKYEDIMYTSWYNTSNGYKRGIAGFDAANFDKLGEDEQANVCRIPFSQPYYYYVILAIWTLTVVQELKDTWMLVQRLVLLTPTTKKMTNAMGTAEDGTQYIESLTYGIKAVIAFISLVRFFVAAILLWLGCRWLSATMNFSDLLLNAVALEFVLMLKDLLYTSLVPLRNKRDTQNTKLSIKDESSHPTVGTFLGSFLWGLVSVLWVLLYGNYFQQVLPDYKFDVHDVCKAWIVKRYAV